MIFENLASVTNFVTQVIMPMHEKINNANTHLDYFQGLVVKPKAICDYKVRWHYSWTATTDTQTYIGDNVFGLLTGSIWKGGFTFNNKAIYLQVALSKEIEKGWSKQLVWALGVDCDILIPEQNKALFMENIKHDARKNQIELTPSQMILLA